MPEVQLEVNRAATLEITRIPSSGMESRAVSIFGAFVDVTCFTEIRINI
jgi:hypothetical protein